MNGTSGSIYEKFSNSVSMPVCRVNFDPSNKPKYIVTAPGITPFL
jgi:hypothetical protein